MQTIYSKSISIQYVVLEYTKSHHNIYTKFSLKLLNFHIAYITSPFPVINYAITIADYVCM